MECPKKECRGKCVTVNSYQAGDGSIRNMVCLKCKARVVVQVILSVLAINPKRGEGAVAIAKKQAVVEPIQTKVG